MFATMNRNSESPKPTSRQRLPSVDDALLFLVLVLVVVLVVVVGRPTDDGVDDVVVMVVGTTGAPAWLRSRR